MDLPTSFEPIISSLTCRMKITSGAISLPYVAVAMIHNFWVGFDGAPQVGGAVGVG